MNPPPTPSKPEKNPVAPPTIRLSATVKEATRQSAWRSPACLPRTNRQTQAMGSKKAPATRSFRGMMALSVIWMSSGQTSVQHLVMLQRPRGRR